MSAISRVETITPTKARKMLEDNKSNRPLRENYVIQLAGAIASGEWMLNGESIKIDTNNNLQDGQHRLNAIVEAKIPVQTLVVRGLPPDVFDTIDRGRSRTIGDVLHRHGSTYHNTVAGALTWLFKYAHGGMSFGGGTIRPRAAQSVDLFEKHRGIEASAHAARPVRDLLSHSLGTFCHYLFGKQNEAMRDKFFEELLSGEGLKRTQAVYKLRERLKDNRAAKAKLPPTVVAALTIKAFNIACNGDSVGVLKFSDNEEFPTLPDVSPQDVA